MVRGQSGGLAMALFWGQECPLCGVKMNDSDRLFATSHFITGEKNADLWQYSDAVIHWDCYAKWEHRPRFARVYFECNQAWSKGNGFWGIAHCDDQVLVKTNPDKYVAEVDVTLAETGSSLRGPLADWEDWLAGECFESCNHEVERDALAVVIPLLRSKVPTGDALVTAAGMEIEQESRIEAAGGMVARISHEFAGQKLAERAATKG